MPISGMQGNAGIFLNSASSEKAHLNDLLAVIAQPWLHGGAAAIIGVAPALLTGLGVVAYIGDGGASNPGGPEAPVD